LPSMKATEKTIKRSTRKKSTQPCEY